MNELDIYSAIGGVGEDILEEAEAAVSQKGSRKISMIPLTAAAACIAVLGLGIYFANRNDNIIIEPGNTGINSITTVPALPEFSEITTTVPEIHRTDSGHTVTTVPEELISVTTVPPCGFPAYTEETMPDPFNIGPDSGGDQYANFLQPCNWTLDSIPGELCDLRYYDEVNRWSYRHWDSKAEIPSSIKDYMNIYAFITDFDITREEAETALKYYLYSDDPQIRITREEFDIIFSGDVALITKTFASEYSIVIGENIYSPEWVYFHSAEDYKAAGITPEMLAEKIDLYSEILFTDEARLAFSEKLSAYIGRTVVVKPVIFPEKVETIPEIIEDAWEEVLGDDTPEEPAELAEEQPEAVTAIEIR